MIKINEVIKLNKRFGGTLINRSNLEFDVDRANREKDIYKSNAYILRGIVQGHSFIDGNKKTASSLVLSRFKKDGIKCKKLPFKKGIIQLAKENNTPINKITRRLKSWCPKK